jgi:hypothetical protein
VRAEQPVGYSTWHVGCIHCLWFGQCSFCDTYNAEVESALGAVIADIVLPAMMLPALSTTSEFSGTTSCACMHACTVSVSQIFFMREQREGGVYPALNACIRRYSTDHILNMVRQALEVPPGMPCTAGVGAIHEQGLRQPQASKSLSGNGNGDDWGKTPRIYSH